MDLLDATLGKYFAQLAGQPVSIVPDLLGEHVNIGGVTVARLVGGLDGVHAYGIGGDALAGIHETAGAHLQVVDAMGAPVFESAAIGHDVAFHDAFSVDLGGGHEDAFGVMHLHNSAGIADAEIHHAVLDHYGGIHDGVHGLHQGFSDLHEGFADFHQGAFDVLDVHHEALASLQDVDFGAVADHLHDVIDPDIFF
jgi:hypothetical protein